MKELFFSVSKRISSKIHIQLLSVENIENKLETQQRKLRLHRSINEKYIEHLQHVHRRAPVPYKKKVATGLENLLLLCTFKETYAWSLLLRLLILLFNCLTCLLNQLHGGEDHIYHCSVCLNPG